MASSTPRSRKRPGARLWLGLLLAAGWSSLEAAPDDRPGRDGPPAAPPEAAPQPERPTPAARRRQRRPAAADPRAIVVPLPPPPVTADIGDPAEAAPAAGRAPAPPAADIGAIAPGAGPYTDAPPLVPEASAPAAESLLQADPRRELRRDPLEPPLGEFGAWRELLLSVTVNGRLASQGTLFAEKVEGGDLAVELASLRLWRVEVDTDRIVTFSGEPYYPLAAIPGATWRLDRAGLGLELTIPPERFAASRLGGRDDGAGATPPPAAGVGGFLDYDLLALAGDDLDQRVDGLVELGAFAPVGALTTSLRLEDVAADPGVSRLDTTLSRDFPATRTTFRLGDSLTGGGALAAPVRFGGLQYATNFGTDPAFVPFPLPTIGGLAEQDSVVDVLIDNLARVRGEVPSGPFAIDEVPVVTGAGEVQLRVTDLLGRERLVTQPYYVSSRLLRPGLRDFSYELGLERGDFGEGSFDYGEPLAVGTERYGLTDRLTAEGHLELQPDLASGTAGGSYLLGGRWGVVSAGLGASASEDGPGAMAELGYEYDGRLLNLGARSRVETADFAQLGSRGAAARTDQLTFGLDLGGAGRLGLLLLNRDSYDDADVTTVSASYGRALGPGSLSLRAAQFLRPDTELALTVAYSLPLGPTRSLATEVERRDGEPRARAQFRQTRGASDLGLDYRLGAEVGEDASALDARASWQASAGAVQLEAERIDGDDRVRGGVNGSVTLLDGRVGLSRQIGRAFGLVTLPGFPDVRVYLDNREVGRTDKEGYLLLPSLRPYEANKVRLEVEDLPLEAALARGEALAVPFDRSGVSVAFDVRRGEAATATLRDAAGKPLPAGMRLAGGEGGAVTVQVARDGFAQVAGPLASPALVEGEAAGRRFACELPAAPAGDPLPDLGAVACR